VAPAGCLNACGRRHEPDVQILVWTRQGVLDSDAFQPHNCLASNTRDVVITVTLPGVVLAAATKAGSQ